MTWKFSQRNQKGEPFFSSSYVLEHFSKSWKIYLVFVCQCLAILLLQNFEAYSEKAAMEWAALCFCLCFCPSLYIRMLGNKVKGGDWNEGTSPMLQWWGLYWSRVGCCYGGDRCHLVLGRGLRAKLRESEERDWQRKKKSGWGVIEKRLKCADMCHLWLLSQLVPC